MSNLTDAIIAAKLVGGSGGSGGGSGSVLPPFKSYALVLTYDSTERMGEGRIYRYRDGQFGRTNAYADFSMEIDVETGADNVVPGELTFDEGASEEDLNNAEQIWVYERVYQVMMALEPEGLETLLPLMVFLS